MTKSWAWFSAIALAASCTSIVTAYAQEKEPTEANEKQITLDQAPKAVRDTLVKEAGKAKITRVESENENGKPIFEAHVQPAQGKEFTVKVDPSGKLLSKGPEKE